MNSSMGIIVLVPLVSLAAIAQDTTKHDPLRDVYGGHPVLANSVEIISLTDTATGASSKIPALRVLDVNGAGQLVADGRHGFPSAPFSTSMISDCISEDFDGDGFAEIVVARIYPFDPRRRRYGGHRTPAAGEAKTRDTHGNGRNGKRSPRTTSNGPIRLMAARLDFSPKKLVVASTDGPITTLTVYSGTGRLTQVMYQMFDTAEFSDLAFGDFNGDGIDDLIRVGFGNDGTYNRLYYGTYYYNATTKHFNWDKDMGFVVPGWSTWKRLKIITGDFRHIGRDEAVIAMTVTSGNSSRPVFLYADMTVYWPFSQGSIPGASPSGYSWGNGWESDAIAVDMNPLKGDGDELVMAGPGEIGILKFNGSLQPYFLAKMVYPTPNAVETYAAPAVRCGRRHGPGHEQQSLDQ